ncbi:MAG: hypothetical protein HYR63_30750 [Proteobacteria bacterium]|nr:hypothetical protein [Pseudomonadota bacterium]MBI3495701.1 hypothetical protein [Pseudomonadota bacterium]
MQRSLLVLAFASLVVAASPAEAQQKSPPTCAAIDFRPVADGMSDGEQEAGLYKSRFGRIEVRGIVKGGKAEDYAMAFNGKKAAPLASLPKSVEKCLAEKKVPVPTSAAQQACGGSKLKVVIDSSASPKIALLYGLQGRSWRFCHAAQV